jgi:hypothetical protein
MQVFKAVAAAAASVLINSRSPADVDPFAVNTLAVPAASVIVIVSSTAAAPPKTIVPVTVVPSSSGCECELKVIIIYLSY